MPMGCRKLDIILDSHTLSKGVRCAMKLHSEALKGKEISIGNQNQTLSTSTQSSKKKSGEIVDNGSSLTYLVCWKNDHKSSDYLPLPFCCVDCGLECVEFRCSSVKFSEDGRCQVPITFWCSPTHSKRPKTTVLILRIEITHNDVHVEGEVPIIFKKHIRSKTRVKKEQPIPVQLQPDVQALNKALHNINNLVNSLPEDRATELESLRRCASLLLAETEKRNPKKMKTSEEEAEQPQHEQEELNYVNTVTATPNHTIVTYPLEIPYPTTTTTTTLPTYTPYATYMPYMPYTETANTTNFTSPFVFEINPLYPLPPYIPLDGFNFQN